MNLEMNSTEKIECQSVVLAALLHDIGKLKQRATFPEDKDQPHSNIGYQWLKTQYGESFIPVGALNHHGNDQNTWETNNSLIIYEADNCAVGGYKRHDPQKDNGQKWHQQVQLTNVFAHVQNPEEFEDTSAQPPNSFMPLSEQGSWIEPILEESRNDENAYRRLWQGFENDFGKLKVLNCHYNIDAISHLLEKYTSNVPSISLKVYGEDDESSYKKKTDISLFDHLRITASSAICLYDYYRERFNDKFNSNILNEEITGNSSWSQDEKPFILIGGDLSGVQNFIYTISSKGALKSLKGRSFFLELYTEHTVDRILEEIGLPRCNVIFTGGGHFYVMAPNVPNSYDVVKRILEETEEYLFNAFNGTIQQHIVAVPFSKNDFKETSPIWMKLSEELDKLKLRKWASRMQTLISGPEMPDNTCLTENCAVCGREDKPLFSLSEDKQEIKACEFCRDQYRLGALIQSAVRRGSKPVICRWKEKPPNVISIRIESYYYHFADKYSEHACSNAEVVFHLNDWNISNFIHPRSRPLLAGIYLPDDDACRDLEGMAENGFGMAKLSVLRMDIDRLGRIFTHCIPKAERTLTRMASLSRQFSIFFKFHINEILAKRLGYPPVYRVVERPDERRVSIVYSGGDDLFLIGHWLDVLEVSIDIHNAFCRITANPYITVSAGVTLGDFKTPVYRLAEYAGHAEETAKGNGRNSITLFDSHVFKWDKSVELDEILKKMLVGLCSADKKCLKLPEGSLSMGILYNLLFLTRENRKAVGWYIHKLAYIFGRFKPNEEYSEYWMSLKNYIFSGRVKDWHLLEVSLLIIIMMLRKEK